MSTPAGGTLSTAGTSMVDILGFNLGVEASAVSISYSGGSTGFTRRTYTPAPGTCTIVQAGTYIRCATVPGVGANYTFTVIVDGVASAPSADLLSYTPPSVGSVAGAGSTRGPARGGASIVLRGTGFGPLNSSTTLVVWAVPAANDSLVFLARDCNVTEAHVTIECVMGPAMGASLTWKVTVEGQNNTLPISSVAGPVVTHAAFADRRVQAADTRGGTMLEVTGRNFGVSVDHTVVSITTSGGVYQATSCTMTAADEVLLCELPPGSGTISRVSVSVLGQTGHLDDVDRVAGLAYARPAVTTTSPEKFSTNVASSSVTVTGSGFGSRAQLVTVTAIPMGDACADTPSSPLNGTSVSVLSDSELQFALRTPVPHVVAGWSLAVSVAGQGLAVPVNVPTSSPSIAIVAIAAPANGTHRFLSLQGTNFGPALSSCSNDVTVTVNGQPCSNLAMTMVRTGGVELSPQDCSAPPLHTSYILYPCSYLRTTSFTSPFFSRSFFCACALAATHTANVCAANHPGQWSCGRRHGCRDNVGSI